MKGTRKPENPADVLRQVLPPVGISLQFQVKQEASNNGLVHNMADRM